MDLDDGSKVHGLFDIQRSDGKIVQGADVTFAYGTQGMRQETDAQDNTVFRLEGGDVLKQQRLGAGYDKHEVCIKACQTSCFFCSNIFCRGAYASTNGDIERNADVHLWVAQLHARQPEVGI